MKAMILAAGYGTRLRPLTYLLPKPLFPVCNKPLIGFALEALLAAGAGEIAVNLHHLPDAIEELLAERYDCTFHFSLEHEILGTGGGVRRLRHVFETEEEFLLVNGDTIQFPPYDRLVEARRRADADAALLLRHPPRGDRFTTVWLENGRVTGFGNGTGEPLMFAGAHAVSGRIFGSMPAREEFGIVGEVYQSLAGKGRIAAAVDDGPWFDVGTPQRYLAANAALRGERSRVDGTARVSRDVARCVVGTGSTIDGTAADSVVWENCRIGAGVRLSNCIVGHDVELAGGEDLKDTIVCRDDAAIPRQEGYRFSDGLVFAPFG